MQLSDAEWIVMNLIWDSQPTEASEVIAALGSENGWSGATVKTMLHRLVKKGALHTESVGKKYRYTAAVRRSDCVRRASRSFLERVFGGDAAPALLHLVRTSKLSDSELAELRELLDAKSSKNKESKE
ncbi:BlaI/MecI/CopY family transcriptional regulator [Roseiconus nitratireducens]|uniref:BlaI/MecI/CopY family transcriptional regulator n=1 Tax=Roseiconus nitratireducens TaxID=2605748 RepID=A0A5M6CW61_9BACT|nr:BlaI/MecI/CopY family transcriptional regulator [Roseiconus nitratireducens]KAA5539468.1 BlaI/MecI/CopY family transcriptional regulator [Roseiconus nitratireducens]